MDSLNERGDLKNFGHEIGCTGVYLSSIRTRQNHMTESLAAKILANIPKTYQVRVARPIEDFDVFPIPTIVGFEKMAGGLIENCKIDGFSWAMMWKEWYQWMDFNFPSFAESKVSVIGGHIVSGTLNDKVFATISYEDLHLGKPRHTVWTLGACAFLSEPERILDRGKWNRGVISGLPELRIQILPFVAPNLPYRQF